MYRAILIIRVLINSFVYLFDKRIPLRYKVIPYLALIYCVSPLDLIPELRLLGVGYIDDIFVLTLSFNYFRKKCIKYLDSLDDQDVIDAEFKVIDEDVIDEEEK